MFWHLKRMHIWVVKAVEHPSTENPCRDGSAAQSCPPQFTDTHTEESDVEIILQSICYTKWLFYIDVIKRLEEERISFSLELSSLSPSLKWVSMVTPGRNWSKAMKERWVFVFYGLLSLPFHAIQDHHPRWSTSHSGLNRPIAIINQKMPLQTCLPAIRWKHFLNLDFLIPDMSSFVSSWQNSTNTVAKR